MCISYIIRYTCGCTREMEFRHCEARKTTNVKCHPVQKEHGKTATNYCSRHLVKPDAPTKYPDQNGAPAA